MNKNMVHFKWKKIRFINQISNMTFQLIILINKMSRLGTCITKYDLYGMTELMTSPRFLRFIFDGEKLSVRW